MTTFDATFISAVVAFIGCFVPLLFEKDKLRKRKIIVVFLILFSVVTALCLMAKCYSWESTILNIERPSSSEEPATTIEHSERETGTELESEDTVEVTEPLGDFVTEEDNKTEHGNENIAESEYSPITYNNGNSFHILSATIVHYPNLEISDFTVGGVWSLDPDFTEADPYELVHSNYSVIVRRNSDGVAIVTGHVQFGTVWSEDDQGNWNEKAEAFNSPFTNRPMPVESYGTFAATLVPSDDLLLGEYTCEIHIQLNGSEYVTEVSFIIN